MAYSPIAFTAANYRDYKFNWLKAYESGTTTPKVMATDSTLGTLIAKAQINVDGFIISAGDALIMPFIDGAYDLWLFPTEALADANDTSSALRLADNITGTVDLIDAGLLTVSASNISDLPEFIDNELINDISQAYEFDTIALMTASEIAFPIKKPLKTKGGITVGDGLGATYITFAAQSLGTGDETLADTNIAVFQYSGSANKADIVLNVDRITANEFDIVSNADRITANESNISALTSSQNSGVFGYATKVIMDADLTPDDQTIAYVTNDAIATNNGTYRKEGATGAGAWTQSSSDLASQAYQLAATNELIISDNDLYSVNRRLKYNIDDTPQLIDKLVANSGFFVDWTTGDLQANSAFTASDYIPLHANTTYHLNGIRYFAVYDIYKVFISGSDEAGSGNKVEVTGSAGAFMRVSALHSDFAISQVSESATLLPLSEYGGNINPDRIISVNGESLQANSATSKGVDFLTTPDKNLINDATLDLGFYQDAAGSIVQLRNFALTDYIAVTVGQEYIYSSVGDSGFIFAYTFFDADKVVLPALGGNGGGFTGFTVVSPAKYVRVSVSTRDIDIQLEAGTIATTYQPFTNELVSSARIDTDSAKFLTPSVNMLEISTSESGKFISPDGTIGNSASFSLSVYIEVGPGVNYIFGSEGAEDTMLSFAAFDENLVVVPSEGAESGVSRIGVPASGVKFYRVTTYNSKIDQQLQKGTTVSAYETYGYKLSSEVKVSDLNGATLVPNGYEGLKMATFGDSITQQNEWQPLVLKRLGLLSSSNHGIGGTAIAGSSANSFWQTVRVDAIDSDADIVVIMGGTNDWAQNKAIGLIDSANTEEFNGAFNVMMEKIMLRFSDFRAPNDMSPTITKKPVRIIINSTPYGEFNGVGFPNSYTNTLGLTTGDYAEQCRLQAKRWNIPLCDIHQLCGWGIYNIGKFMKQDGALLHPNDAGADRLAGVVSGVLESIPINL